MDNKTLNLLLKDENFLNQRIEFYKEKNILSKSDSEHEVKGHLEKSRHNLNFLAEIKKEYDDWALVTCYYASYHAALALITLNGYSSKNHNATLCILIKDFYKKELSKKDIELLNLFDANDLLFYAESRNKREEASYSTKINFNPQEVNKIKLKTRLFINKVDKIIKEKD